MAEAAAPPASTTTLSTIAVKAGDTSTVVVALLKAQDHYEIRIDEMNPRLLTIGGGVEETSELLRVHEELIKRLREKEDKVQALLARADALGSEKENPNEAIVYDAMALNLHQAWKELNKQLMLRGYLLNETLKFYRMARHHEQLTMSVSDVLRRAAADNDSNDIVKRIEQIADEIIDTTASAVDLGSSVIAQIRALGQIDDNEGRAQEILAACVCIENVMLRIATEWERVEQTWAAEKEKLGLNTLDIEGTLVQIEEWLKLAEKKIKALNEGGQKRLLEEGNSHVAKLHEIASTGVADGTRVSHLRGRIEEFLHYLKTRMNRSHRIQAFFQASQSMLSQLSMMEADLLKANAAMAGELVPLAKQKASSVIHEGKEILAREVLSYDEQRIVKQRCGEMEAKLLNLENIAKQSKEVKETISKEVEQLKTWMFTKAEPFLAQNADMGSSLNDAREFVSKHKEFASEVVNQDANVLAALSKKSDLGQSSKEALQEFEQQYEKLKDILENRIQIGSQFEQVHKFAKDLESSFDALTSLLDTNRDFTNEKVAGQMTNVFQMIQETLGQEKTQGEKFVVAAEQTGRNDEQLTVQRASESVRNIITDHEHRFTYVTSKWLEWQQAKSELKRLEKIVEEVEMWQEDAIEVIKVLQQPAGSVSTQEAEAYATRFEKIRQSVDVQNQKIHEAMRYTHNEQFVKRVSEVSERQQQIEGMLFEIKKMEVQQLVRIIEEVEMWQDDAVEVLRKHHQTHQNQRQALEVRLKEVKQSAPAQMHSLQRVRNQNTDEMINRRLDVMTERQKQIQGMIEDIELIELQELRKTIEEVEMWQEDALEIIRSASQQTVQNREIVKEKLDRVVVQLPQQAEKVSYLKRHTDKAEVAEKIYKVARNHDQIKLTVDDARKAIDKKFVKIVEEIEMWQEEVIEIIRTLLNTTVQSRRENEMIQERLNEIKRKLPDNVDKINEIKTTTTTEEAGRVQRALQKQEEITKAIDQLERKIQTVDEDFLQQEARLRVKAPEIITNLIDSQVDEGSRYEFTARISGEPEPTISWLKDGIDVKNTMDYRQDYVNGIATLTIEETFIEDTATYTVRASNAGGTVESNGRLIVKSRSALDSIFEEEKPHVVKQLRNTVINEGETAHMDCVIVGHPEPEVVWYKEEKTLTENERTRLDFAGDHCSVTIQSSIPSDSGLYTAKAKNIHGETTSFCQLKVAPKKQPPPTPPKPTSRPSSVMARPPSIQPALTNSTWSEGQTASLQVLIQGEPRPAVQWLFNDQPIQQTSQVHIEEKSDGWSRLIISPVQAHHAGLYTVVADNEAGEARTGASLHVSQSITTEHMYQQDMYEKINMEPVATTVQTRNASSLEVNDRSYHEHVNHELSPIPNEKRWVEIIEEEMRQASQVVSPVPQVEENRKRVITEQRWVDEIDEVLQIPKNQAVTTKVHTEYGHKINEAPQPEIRHSTTTPSNKMFNVATIRQSPQPEIHKATTSSTTTEHVATIRQGVHPESYQATIKPATSIENIAVTHQNPQKEVFRATTTPTSALENVAQVHAPITVQKQDIMKEGPRINRVDDVVLQAPEPSAPHTSVHVTEQSYITRSNQQAPQPAVRTTTTTTISEQNVAKRSLDRTDSQDVITQIQRTSEEIDNTKRTINQIPESPRPQRKFPQPLTTVKTSGEGWVQEVHDEAGKPIVKTVRTYIDEESENVSGKKMMMVPGSEKTITIVRTAEDEARSQQKSQIPKLHPQTTTTVSHSGEGWVQEVYDQAGKPTVKTVRRYTDEESDNISGKKIMSVPASEKTITIVRQNENEESRLAQKSQIPKAQPQTSTTVTESGEGWVQEVHDEAGKPRSTTVRVYRDDESQDVQMRQHSKIPVRREPQTTTTTSGEGWVQETHQQFNKPSSTTTRTYNDHVESDYHRVADDATSEISKGHRDSYILASDAEGFWTDGAYTGSPTPPPMSRFTTQQDFKQDIGTSQVSSEPEFVRPFQKDYTVEEGGSITIECMLVGNPKPKVTVYFNNQTVRTNEFLEITSSSDTYVISIKNARLDQAGYYKIVAENKKGFTETLTVLHVRPRSLPKPVVTHKVSKPSEHTTVTEEFAMFEYEQRRPTKHEMQKISEKTPPPAKKLQQVHKRDEEHLEQYDIDERKVAGHPPHFTQTLVSTVASDGEGARFEGVVTGWPAPSIQWTKDGAPLSTESLPGISISNIGGRLSLVFDKCTSVHSGKYMCTATNVSGVATSSAQLVVRPKTIAPDFIQRLISEEVVEGQQLKWTVRVTGDPKPKIIWMRDGVEIPNCDEVRLVDEGNGFHSLVIVRAEVADSGQFTCLAENFVGEARSTADLVVRPAGAPPGNYFHVTKVTQERQVKGEEPVRNSSFTIENPRPSAML
ncbi:unnamed protein product [Auanema sp. JU1783]|nr:unnamed protein product [Auanema sp. JU1783]